MSQKPIHRIAILISLVSFFGSTAFAAVRSVNTALSQPTQNTTTAASSVQSQRQLQESQLKLQEREYEVVLKQEPENEIALAGLVEARLQMNNVKGAVKPLKKLVKLHPSQQEYKTLLAQVKQQVGKSDR
jgi:cytochrome c-type biogenesis protein CcmH/NrfG